MAPGVLIGVVVIGVAGRAGPVAPEARASVGAVAAPALVADVPARPLPSEQAARPGRNPTHRQREEGTDGLMGSLPFGIPGDTPYARGDRVNRFTIDDTVQVQIPFRAAPPWIRRNGALTS